MLCVVDEHVFLHLGSHTAEAARRRAARQSRLKIQMFAESSSVAEELERNYSSLSDCEEGQLEVGGLRHQFIFKQASLHTFSVHGEVICDS